MILCVQCDKLPILTHTHTHTITHCPHLGVNACKLNRAEPLGTFFQVALILNDFFSIGLFLLSLMRILSQTFKTKPFVS